ncbi:hypothetical protein AWM70_07375 [Paenibacillus yonginensis]|uniref:Uncharacterized protein n=1 Tax=Paenibacillus yonginensis TaxID=1462996 RepID=A0A1B1MZ25_9BACL|nr:hypothetical protein [Paenibacillus yonginensis]ANS74421.1 hypothetical protein AWM70_07375 [Paenibacillus yonginensis]
MNKPRKVYVYAISGKTVRSIKIIILVDVLLGTGLYFTVKWVTSSLLISTIGSIAGSEGYKWRLRKQRFKVVSVKKRPYPSRINEQFHGKAISLFRKN